MSNRLVNNVSAKKRAQEIGSSVATGAVKGVGTTGSMRGAATGAVKGVSSGVTKDPTVRTRWIS